MDGIMDHHAESGAAEHGYDEPVPETVLLAQHTTSASSITMYEGVDRDLLRGSLYPSLAEIAENTDTEPDPPNNGTEEQVDGKPAPVVKELLMEEVDELTADPPPPLSIIEVPGGNEADQETNPKDKEEEEQANEDFLMKIVAKRAAGEIAMEEEDTAENQSEALQAIQQDRMNNNSKRERLANGARFRQGWAEDNRQPEDASVDIESQMLSANDNDATGSAVTDEATTVSGPPIQENIAMLPNATGGESQISVDSQRGVPLGGALSAVREHQVACAVPVNASATSTTTTGLDSYGVGSAVDDHGLDAFGSSPTLIEAYPAPEHGEDMINIGDLQHATVLDPQRTTWGRRFYLAVGIVAALVSVAVAPVGVHLAIWASNQEEEGSSLMAGPPNSTSPRTLQIIHSSEPESGLQDANTFEEKILHFSALVKGLRGLGYPSLMVNPGDLTSPGPFYEASAMVPGLGSNGLGDILIANAMGLQASVVANNDMDGGIDDFAVMLAKAEFPYLSDNLDFSNVTLATGTPRIKIGPDGSRCSDVRGQIVKSCYVEKDNIGRVGLIGESPNRMFAVINKPDESLPGLDFIGGRDPETRYALVDASKHTRDQIKLLESKGVDIIILLDGGNHFHDLSGNIIEVPDDLEGLDIVVRSHNQEIFAHSNSFGPFNLLRHGDKADASYPIVRRGMNGSLTLYVTAGGLSYEYIGNLIVTFDSDGKITSWDGRSGIIATTEESIMLLEEVVGAQLEPAPGVENTFKQLQETQLVQDLFALVGSTNYLLNGERKDARVRETNLGRVTADAFLFVANKGSFEQGLPSIDVALVNSGSIRGSINGPKIPKLLVQTTFAFNNKLVVTEINTGQLIAALENGVKGSDRECGCFPLVAGLRVAFNTSMPTRGGTAFLDKPSRLISLLLENMNGTEEVLVEDYKAVGNLNRTIRVATTDYMVGGGDGFHALAGGKVLSSPSVGQQGIFQEYVQLVLNGTVDVRDPPPRPRLIQRT